MVAAMKQVLLPSNSVSFTLIYDWPLSMIHNISNILVILTLRTEYGNMLKMKHCHNVNLLHPANDCDIHVLQWGSCMLPFHDIYFSIGFSTKIIVIATAISKCGKLSYKSLQSPQTLHEEQQIVKFHTSQKKYSVIKIDQKDLSTWKIKIYHHIWNSWAKL